MELKAQGLFMARTLSYDVRPAHSITKLDTNWLLP